MSSYPKDIYENGEFFRYCKMCKEFHTLDKFYKLKDDKYTRYCREKNIVNRNAREHTGLNDVENQSDKMEAERILTAMGYELYNNDNPIHQQFLRRIQSKYGGLD